jgi:hypothetical protein
MAERRRRTATRISVRVFARSARRSAERLWVVLESTVAIVGLLFVIALAIPWIADRMADVGFSNGEKIAQTVITVVLVSIFFQVRRVGDAVAERGVDETHMNDPMDVYPVLEERMELAQNDGEKVLDVLGITLYTAWPSVRFLVGRRGLSGWTVRLAACGGPGDMPAHVPLSWRREATSNLNAILEAALTSALRSNRVQLEAYGYDFAPAVHGFRLSNGDLFYSTLLWEEDGSALCMDRYSYDFIPGEDDSAYARAAREVFNSWFERAMRLPWRKA